MTALREAAERVAGIGRFPAGNPDRRLECEKAAARLEAREPGRAAQAEPWDDFLRRIGVIGG